MPYRFSSTTGNIVRPIESLCLNASTGAIITPLRYGPAGSTITMWNGVVEYYNTLVRAKPTTHATPVINFGSPAYAYDTSTYGDTTTYANGSTGTRATFGGCTYYGFQSLTLSGRSSITAKFIQKYELLEAIDQGYGSSNGQLFCSVSRDGGSSWARIFRYNAPLSKTDTSIQSYNIPFSQTDNLSAFRFSITVTPATYDDMYGNSRYSNTTVYYLYDLWVEVN